ncbi:MAG: ATP-binding protein, partial [Bacillota bacterium]
MKRITIIGGAFGSGKTEFALACALKKRALTDGKTGLIDLDIVNPYFRSRDRAAELEKLGVTVISTQPGFEYADLPALSPQIYALLQDQTYQVVVDVGGDPVGARALGRFNPYFNREAYDFWAV